MIFSEANIHTVDTFKYSKLGQWIHIHYQRSRYDKYIYSSKYDLIWSRDLRTDELCAVAGNSGNLFIYLFATNSFVDNRFNTVPGNIHNLCYSFVIRLIISDVNLLLPFSFTNDFKIIIKNILLIMEKLSTVLLQLHWENLVTARDQTIKTQTIKTQTIN